MTTTDQLDDEFKAMPAYRLGVAVSIIKGLLEKDTPAMRDWMRTRAMEFLAEEEARMNAATKPVA